MSDIVTDEELERYLTLCRNPLRNDAVVASERAQLFSLPEVTAVGFKDEHTLLVGTSMISLTDPETKLVHNVGEFIIYLYRQRVGKIWDSGFAFENISGTQNGRNNNYHHPHINNREIPGIGKLGILCIQQGHFHVYQHLRSGEMHLATKLLIDILNTYNLRGPYLPLDHWPLKGE
tara:strand:- start:6280 stop:6807 length:528 start_codon:yes stop_codon:yes gene_type:complete